MLVLLLLLLLLIWQSPGLPGWRKVNLITVTRRPLHPSIAAGFFCLTTSPGFLPALCEKWSGFFYVHRVWLSYTRDRRLKVSSERLSNEDKAPCPRALLPGQGSTRGPPVWKSEVLTARPRQLLNGLLIFISAPQRPRQLLNLLNLYYKIFKLSKLLGGGGVERYVCPPPPNIFIGGGGGDCPPAPSPPPRIDASGTGLMHMFCLVYLSIPVLGEGYMSSYKLHRTK